LLHRSKFPQSHGPGFCVSQTRGDALVRKLLDMKFNFALKFRVGMGAVQQ